MKIKKVLLVFLIVVAGIFPAKAATNEGYGEDEQALGQFVDSFENLDNVSVVVNVFRNATLDCMELNFSAGAAGPIFFDDFEANNLNKWTFANGWTTGNAYEKNGIYGARGLGSNKLLYKDLGADYSVDLEFTVWMYPKIYRSYLFLQDHSGAPAHVVYVFHDAASNSFKYYDGITRTLLAGCPEYNWYLIKVNDIDFVAKTYDVYIYDSAENLLGFKQIPFVGPSPTSLDWIQFQAGTGTSGDVYIDDVILTSAFVSASGYFITTDYLSDPLANGMALVHLSNTTIPANTAITLEFSEDNSTWVLNDWQPLFGGFESIDLRDLEYSAGYYVRHNLSTTDPAVTPRVYQSRVITTIGNVSAPEIMNVTGSWIEYNATAISAIVGTVDDGDLGSTFFIDGDMFNVSETVGTPGMLISINFTDVDPAAESLWILFYGQYDGNLNHDFDIEVWNFETSTWIEDSHIPDMAAFDWINSTIYPIRIPNEFLRDGEVRVRLDHESPGNINHDLFIEYVRLQAFIPLESAAETFQLFWIPIAIALMMGGIMLSKMWFDEGDP